MKMGVVCAVHFEGATSTKNKTAHNTRYGWKNEARHEELMNNFVIIKLRH